MRGYSTRKGDLAPFLLTVAFCLGFIFSSLVIQTEQRASDNRASFLLYTYFFGVSMKQSSLLVESGSLEEAKMFAMQNKDAPCC